MSITERYITLVIFYPKINQEKEIAVIPDTKYFNRLDDVVKNSDVIITECTYLSATDESHARKN